MRSLGYYIKPNAGRIALGLVIKLAGTVTDLLIPWILAYMIDTVVPRGSIAALLYWGGAMALCAAVSLAGNIIANRMAARTSGNITRRIRYDLFEKISSLSCEGLDAFTIPTLISRLTSDTYNVHTMLARIQRLGVRAPILLVGGVAITLSIDPVLALVLIAMLPLTGLTVYLISKKGIPLYQKVQRRADALVRTLRENITGVRVIKALSKTPDEKRRFAGVNLALYRAEKKVSGTMALSGPLMGIFLNLGLVGVLLAGAYRVNGGMTLPGEIIAFMTYFSLILNSMLSITKIFILTSKGYASFKRISEVLEAPGDLEEEPGDVCDNGCHIEFEGVTFAYAGSGAGVKDVSFAVKRGQTLGIIGATGSGKSTLVRLLMRFYDAQSGSVRIGGRDVKSIPAGQLHTKFGVVFQNDILFADTIAENIDFGRNLGREALERAARTAQAAEFIAGYEDGLDHRLTVRGANLSGGQKQRVLVARAFAGEPEILVLDDASSALDYATDAKLRRSMASLPRETTKIIVAQRISSVMHADIILVMEAGRIAAAGSHEQLMAESAVYREIGISQLGGDFDG
ncbi:MAG TPA: ABC transporter ATP-binding protein [Clostridiales bacterium]|nr:MAG: putative ABC transporter ATP-binding protein [Firmicutes bacterium ADurb.Bin262]HOU09937.1 ABC transporter ATP-binding protein [Clostridiales bacterium]HQK73181.1 ABC transporter ATP-binding protein [Clostridiales bacterium]